MSYFDRKVKLLDSVESLKKIVQIKLSENVEDLEFFEKELEDLNFNVLCLGDFSSGKSTFINNFFLEDKVKLPVRVTTTTAKLTIVKYGKELKVLAIMKDGSRQEIKENIEESLKSMVAAKGTQLDNIEFVEVQIPSDILKEGIVIVDSPGLNDPETERMDITFRFVNQADCVLYFLSAHQAWKNNEKEFLEDKILSKDDLDKIFFLINYWDNIVDEKEREDLLSHVNSKILESTNIVKEKLQKTSINKPPLIPISARTGENFDKLKTELFSYLGNKKAQDILEQKIKKYNVHAENYLSLIEKKITLLSKDKESILLKQEELKQELKKYQDKVKDTDKYITREVANKYDMFVENLQYEYKSIVKAFKLNLESKQESIKKKEDFEEHYKRALKKAEIDSTSSIEEVAIKFKKSIIEIFEKQKSKLKIPFKKVIDNDYLNNKIFRQSASLNDRDKLSEQLAAGLGIMATLTGTTIGTTMLVSSASQSAIAAWGVGLFSWASGMSALTIAGIAAAPLAIIGVGGYFVLKNYSENKFKEAVENAIEDNVMQLKENYNDKIREMRQAEDTVSEMIAENISNEFIEQYQLKIDEYEEITALQNSDYDAKNDLNGVKDEISSLRIM